MNIKDFLWDLFPYFYYKYDTYKDVDGKGLLQRLVETLGTGVDEEVMVYLDENSNKYYLNNLDASKVDIKLIDHLSETLGTPPSIFDDSEYRKLLQYIVPIYKIKGTLLSYKLFLNLLGFDVQLVEHAPEETTLTSTIPSIYDIGTIYDDILLYDTDLTELSLGCKYCSEYSLVLTQIGPNQLTLELIEKIKQVLFLIEPINAILRHITLALPDFSEEGLLCFKQDILFKTMTILRYDQVGNLYDETLLYDENVLEQINTMYLDCDGSILLEGIGYWDLEGENIIN